MVTSVRQRALMLLLCIGLLLLPTVSRAEGDVRVLFNGEAVVFEVPPVIESDRTFVPVRFVVQRIGAAVDWDAGKRRVTVKLGRQTVVLTIGSRDVLVNDQVRQMDVAPFIRQDRTMVPLRFISETFGFGVDWDAQARTVVLVTPDKVESGSGAQTGTGGTESVIVGGPGAPVSGTAVVLEAPNSLKVGDTFLVVVKLQKVTGVAGSAIFLHFDSDRVEAVRINSGLIVEGVTGAKGIEPVTGVVKYATAIPGGAAFTGSGTLYSVIFRAKAAGTATFDVEPDVGGTMLMSGSLQPIPVATSGIAIRIDPN